MLQQLAALALSGVLAFATPHLDSDAGSAVQTPLPSSELAITSAAASPVAPQDVASVRILNKLRSLSNQELIASFGGGSALANQLRSAPPAATVVAQWWNTLPQDRQQFATELEPTVFGNLEGLPIDVRDKANRKALRELELRLRSEAPQRGRGMSFHAADTLNQVADIKRALTAPARLPERYLLSLDIGETTRAGVIIGDLNSAEYVSLLVPGMFFKVGGQLADWSTMAAGLHADQLGVLVSTGNDTEPEAASTSVATIAWIGYDTPDLFSIASLDRAEQGAKALEGALDGIRALRGVDPYLTLVAHSYGSTTAMLALQNNTGRGGLTDSAVNLLGVDAVVIVGSPGGTVSSARELGVDTSAVFVGAAVGDPIARLGYFGVNPGDVSYGATSFAVDGGFDRITGENLRGAFGHLDYFQVGSQSLRNISLAALGLGELVTTAADGVAQAATSH